MEQNAYCEWVRRIVGCLYVTRLIRINMLRYRRGLLLLTLSFLFVALVPAQAGLRAQSAQFKLFLPLMIVPPAASPFGFDVRSYASDAALQYAKEARAKWARAGNVFWSDVEPVRGSYRWEALAELDENIRRLQEV